MSTNERVGGIVVGIFFLMVLAFVVWHSLTH
jgi:hypothetical protein